MDLHEIVKKLVGKINPVGETTTDNERFENLRVLCALVENLIIDIDNVNYQNKQSHEYSVKRAAEYADNFLTKTIGIKE